jgi:ubiquinone/menaquinone biosynthesis C-methylase UbiE
MKLPAPHVVQADFDRIARLPESGWDHNRHYHAFLLGHLPVHVETACEVGCGTGVFARRLAARARQVLALDLSPEMLRVAQARSHDVPHIRYEQADVMTYDLGAARFDCIASIATLHHLPLETILPKLGAALKPGGVLLVLDLFQSPGVMLSDLVAVPLHLALTLVHHRGIRSTAEAQAAWAAHGEHDSYLPLARIRTAAGQVLPGAVVRKHLLWRYSLVWRKPG